jgi:hypothetical protein
MQLPDDWLSVLGTVVVATMTLSPLFIRRRWKVLDRMSDRSQQHLDQVERDRSSAYDRVVKENAFLTEENRRLLHDRREEEENCERRRKAQDEEHEREMQTMRARLEASQRELAAAEQREHALREHLRRQRTPPPDSHKESA